MSIILSFIPIIGDTKDVQEAITGIDLVTGKKIAWWERVITVATALIPLVGGALARKGMKLSNDGVRKIVQAAANASRLFLILRKIRNPSFILILM